MNKPIRAEISHDRLLSKRCSKSELQSQHIWVFYCENHNNACTINNHKWVLCGILLMLIYWLSCLRVQSIWSPKLQMRSVCLIIEINFSVEMTLMAFARLALCFRFQQDRTWRTLAVHHTDPLPSGVIIQIMTDYMVISRFIMVVSWIDFLEL